MKYRIVICLLSIIYASCILAQEDNDYVKLKNEGNEALRSQNYQKALESYEAALAIWPADEATDAAMIYNLAECARRLNNDEKALNYYEQSLSLDYRADRSAFYIASSLKALDREEEMEQMLLKSIETYKTSNILAQMKKMLVTYYLKKGAEHYNKASQTLASASKSNPSQYDEINQRANDAFVEAKPWFEKALDFDPENANASNSLKEINSRLSEKK